MHQRALRLAPFAVSALLVAVVTVTHPGETRPAGPPPRPARHIEALGRGVVAIPQGEGRVFVGWRHLATEPGDVGFHVYRVTGRGKPVRPTQPGFYLGEGMKAPPRPRVTTARVGEGR